MSDKEIKVKAGVKNRRIEVDYLARVEGEGSLLIDVRDGNLQVRRSAAARCILNTPGESPGYV